MISCNNIPWTFISPFGIIFLCGTLLFSAESYDPSSVEPSDDSPDTSPDASSSDEIKSLLASSVVSFELVLGFSFNNIYAPIPPPTNKPIDTMPIINIPTNFCPPFFLDGLLRDSTVTSSCNVVPPYGALTVCGCCDCIRFGLDDASYAYGFAIEL